eukprot:14933411-Alexandrium_andersonii.AAC.1
MSECAGVPAGMCGSAVVRGSAGGHVRECRRACAGSVRECRRACVCGHVPMCVRVACARVVSSIGLLKSPTVSEQTAPGIDRRSLFFGREGRQGSIKSPSHDARATHRLTQRLPASCAGASARPSAYSSGSCMCCTPFRSCTSDSRARAQVVVQAQALASKGGWGGDAHSATLPSYPFIYLPRLSVVAAACVEGSPTPWTPREAHTAR